MNAPRNRIVASLLVIIAIFVSSCRTSPPKSEQYGTVYPVWFGTNRKPVIRENGLSFTAESYHQTTRGRADVFIPKGHRFGETGTPLWRRGLRGEFRDDHLEIKETALLSDRKFYDQIRSAIKLTCKAEDKSQALVFLHGYNVTFEEAAIRAAQIGFDLKVPGPTAFFSWPSEGNPAAYRADEKSMAASEGAITDFLVEFAEKSGATNINLIAHSMGNRGLLAALQRMATNAEMRGAIKFNQIFLAAPDVSRTNFMQLAHVYAQMSRRTTLYTSNGDIPVWLSSVVNDGPRAGYFKPYTVAPGVDTIAVPSFNIDLLGHSYFAQAEALLYDIRSLILHDEAPTERMRLSATREEGLSFWELGR